MFTSHIRWKNSKDSNPNSLTGGNICLYVLKYHWAHMHWHILFSVHSDAHPYFGGQVKFYTSKFEKHYTIENSIPILFCMSGKCSFLNVKLLTFVISTEKIMESKCQL